MVSVKDYIVIDPKVMLGKPVIKGTRIPVYVVLNLLAEGLTQAQVVRNYPDLSLEAIQACLIFASKRAEFEEEKILETNR